MGAFATVILAITSGKLNWHSFLHSCVETAKNTAMIYFIVLGASFFNGFLALTQIPNELVAWVQLHDFNPWLILLAILLLYLLLGCVMDSLSIILLTLPIFLPLVQDLDVGISQEALLIWFGILVLMVVEMGLITPPVGLNLFIIQSIQPHTPVLAMYKAVAYFIGFDILRLVLLVAFPAISLVFID